MEEASLSIQATPDTIHKALLDALALPEWNEAFLTIEGPAEPLVGKRYRLRVRPGLSGWLEYTAIEATRVEITWHVPGFHETGTWLLDDHLTTHSFHHTGLLAAALRSSYRGIAAVRLERLQRRLAVLGSP